MTEKVDDSIIRRIQKLLALGNGKGATEAEASNAMDMAQDLLAKYNLDMAVVREAAVAGGTVLPKEKRERSKINKSAMYQWQQDLCRKIAECNYCWYWAQNFQEPYQTRQGEKVRTVKRHVIIGSEVNAVAVRMMYEYLVETLEEILPYENKDRLSKSAISWRQGCVERLMERIYDKWWKMRHDAETAATAGTKSYGLMIRNMDQHEYAANYDALYGEGMYARTQAASAERAEARKNEVATPEKKLTKTEQEAEDRRWEKTKARWRREEQRKLDSRDQNAFNAGREVGETISLADRLGGGK